MTNINRMIFHAEKMNINLGTCNAHILYFNQFDIVPFAFKPHSYEREVDKKQRDN